MIAMPPAALADEAGHGAALRHAGREQGWVPSPALAPSPAIITPQKHQQRKPDPVLVHKIMVISQAAPGHAFLLRYKHIQGNRIWYAVAAVGKKAIAYVPGQKARSRALYLQKRAKLTGEQIGLARDVGAAQVTIGYLYTNHGRSDLVPYVHTTNGQHFAALTFTLKR